MNLFDGLKKYSTSWTEVERRDFNSEEIATVKEAHVEESTYGLSMCFILKSGGMSYIPLDKDSQLGIGDSASMENLQVVTLRKEGESDIQRVIEKSL